MRLHPSAAGTWRGRKPEASICAESENAAQVSLEENATHQAEMVIVDWSVLETWLRPRQWRAMFVMTNTVRHHDGHSPTSASDVLQLSSRCQLDFCLCMRRCHFHAIKEQVTRMQGERNAGARVILFRCHF